MSPVFDTADETQLLAGLRQARQAVARGEVVVLPTDTVYGVGADAFSPSAVQRLLDAKGRGRDQPPPVLVGSVEAMTALVSEVPPAVRDLVDAFWPGGLTIVLPAQPSLIWDLGETRGTVAVRMPDQRIARELLLETGPLAVSSANLTGRPAAITVASAADMLGDAVSVYLDGGPSATGVASTIVDCTLLAHGADLGDLERPLVRVLREGAVSRDRLRDVLGDLLEPDAKPAELAAADVPAGTGVYADVASADADEHGRERAPGSALEADREAVAATADAAPAAEPHTAPPTDAVPVAEPQAAPPADAVPAVGPHTAPPADAGGGATPGGTAP